MGTPSSQPNPYREATKFPEIEGSWGGEGLLLELLEGTDSEAAVAHVGVRGTLSLRLGGPRTAGDERIYLGPRSLLLGPFPGPSCPHPHSGHPSSCTKVAVVPVLPTPGARVGSLLPVLPPASAPILDNLVHSYSWIAQLCVCVCVCVSGVGVGLAGVGLAGVWEGLGERWRIVSPTPFPNFKPQKPGREGAYSRCRVSCRVPGRAAPGWLSQSNTVLLLGNSKTGERVGWGPGVPHVQLCIFRGVLCLVPAVGIYVCVNPFPMPCMTCDAADTTILCAGVLGGTEGHVPVLLHPPPCDPCTRL